MTENAARDFTDKNADAAKAAYRNTQAAAEDATKVIEQAVTKASKGAADFNQKFLEMAQENMNAAFDFARQLTSVKSPSEIFELSAAHARKQLEAFAKQSQNLMTIAQKTTSEAVQPLQAGAAKIFNKSA